MATLKKIVIGFAGLIIGLLIIGLFLPKQYNVERSIFINAEPQHIYTDVVDLREWKNWGVWFKRDPNMVLHYSGPDRAIGMRSTWESDTEGNGEMEITHLEFNKKVVYSLYFPEFDMGSVGEIELEPTPDGTLVTWRDKGEVGNNPIDRYFVLIMDELIGPDFEMGLENLKTIVENRH